MMHDSGYRSVVTTTAAAAASLSENAAAHVLKYGSWDGNLTLASSVLLAEMENSAAVRDSLVIDGPNQPLVPGARMIFP